MGRRSENRGGRVAHTMAEVFAIAGEGIQPGDRAIAAVADVLSAGGLALIPTETVYGLSVAVAPFAVAGTPCDNAVAADPADPAAPLVNGAPLPAEGSGYRRIFSVKRRELTQTVPWLVADAGDLDRYGRDVDDATRALAAAFWPGALTLIVRANDRVPRFMRAADGTVALRCSASPVVAALIEACGCPLATTSANTHGKPAPASWEDVEPAVLAGVDAAIDAGETPCRDASTIVSCVSGELVVARRGALPIQDIERVVARAGARAHTQQAVGGTWRSRSRI